MCDFAEVCTLLVLANIAPGHTSHACNVHVNHFTITPMGAMAIALVAVVALVATFLSLRRSRPLGPAVWVCLCVPRMDRALFLVYMAPACLAWRE